MPAAPAQKLSKRPVIGPSLSAPDTYMPEPTAPEACNDACESVAVNNQVAGSADADGQTFARKVVAFVPLRSTGCAAARGSAGADLAPDDRDIVAGRGRLPIEGHRHLDRYVSRGDTVQSRFEPPARDRPLRR